VSVVKALGRPASEAEIAEYLDPLPALGWRSRAPPTTATLWRCCPLCCSRRRPSVMVCGVEDGFQTVDYAERYAREIPETRLVRIKSAGHIPMENDPEAVAGALAEFFAAKQ
jgi:pimeloyl-ACP methyl ester carboxylesterase